MIKVLSTEIEDVKIIEPKIFYDNRGYFFESYNQLEFHKEIGKINFVQDNESKSSYGVLRGLHYQKAPYEQAKLVRVISGSIQDIAVDIRKESPTYLQHVSVILDDKLKKQLFIPRGFAHGFLVLSDEAVVSYKVDNFFNSDCDANISFNDKCLNIKWQLNSKIFKVSKKDSA